ncbi:hypothetical protein AMTR_s00085p00178590 [Amborella trichopoda]|uniref:Uncharacterized protein n=1 Tax=Amborella trichopoda TaxID=13333 RepID=W1P596_AMBTC|nr:hypothetical protein AMTR_s00085p00178590 [Amborella trichopoda]
MVGVLQVGGGSVEVSFGLVPEATLGRKKLWEATWSDPIECRLPWEKGEGRLDENANASKEDSEKRGRGRRSAPNQIARRKSERRGSEEGVGGRANAKDGDDEDPSR